MYNEISSGRHQMLSNRSKIAPKQVSIKTEEEPHPELCEDRAHDDDDHDDVDDEEQKLRQ